MIKNPIIQSAVPSLIMLTLMWGGFLMQYLGLFSNCDGAIISLVPSGLKGIVLSPFLHGSLEHILSNSLPIAVMVYLLFLFYPTMAKTILIYGTLMTGFLVWLLPSMDLEAKYYITCIIGASGVAYMLAFFLFFSGVFRKNPKLLTISLLVALYFGSMIWGLFPEEFFQKMDAESKISWQSHLSGAVVGTIFAWVYKGKGEKKRKFVWEYPNYYSEKDDLLWQKYQAEHPEDCAELPQITMNDEWAYLDEIRKNS